MRGGGHRPHQERQPGGRSIGHEMNGQFVEPREAMRAIKPGDRVFIAMGGEPLSLIDALLEEKDRLRDVQIISGLSQGGYKFLGEGYLDTFHYSTWQIPLRMASAIHVGKSQFLPISFFQIPSLLSPQGPLPIDVGLISASPPDEAGYLSLGVSVGHTMAVVKNAKVVIAEVNKQMPRTLGNSLVHISEIDYLTEADHPLIEAPLHQPSERDRRIGELVAGLIPDGATVEIGFGAIPNAVYGALKEKRDLGIHSGMISDGLIGLVEAGVVTNSRKTLNPGKTVTGEVLGTRAILDYVAGNPAIEMHTVEYTHGPHVLSQLDGFCAINSAVEIDLSGQINAEFIGELEIGPGGQFDFTLGAALARGGKSIVALPSTAMQGTASRIVHRLKPGVPVTVPRCLAHYVVTEYGVADLRYRNLNERAAALISIAHPDFRHELQWRFSNNAND